MRILALTTVLFLSVSVVRGEDYENQVRIMTFRQICKEYEAKDGAQSITNLIVHLSCSNAELRKVIRDQAANYGCLITNKVEIVKPEGYYIDKQSRKSVYSYSVSTIFEEDALFKVIVYKDYANQASYAKIYLFKHEEESFEFVGTEKVDPSKHRIRIK